MSVDGCSQKLQHVSLLQLESHHCGEDAFHKSTSLGRLSPEARLPMHARVTDDALTDVVGGLKPFDVAECPERSFQVENLGRHTGGFPLRAHDGVSEEPTDSPLDLAHPPLEVCPEQRSVAD